MWIRSEDRDASVRWVSRHLTILFSFLSIESATILLPGLCRSEWGAGSTWIESTLQTRIRVNSDIHHARRRTPGCQILHKDRWVYSHEGENPRLLWTGDIGSPGLRCVLKNYLDAWGNWHRQRALNRFNGTLDTERFRYRHRRRTSNYLRGWLDRITGLKVSRCVIDYHK